MMEKYIDWFWNTFFLDAGVLEESPSAVRALLETMPLVLGAMVLFTIFIVIQSLRVRREGLEEEEEEPTELDKEIEVIRKLQRKRVYR